MASHGNSHVERQAWRDNTGAIVGYGDWIIVCTDCDRDHDAAHVFEVRRVRRLRFPPDAVAEAEAALEEHRRLTNDW